MIVPLDHVIIVAGIIFIMGLIGVLVRRNILFILMSVEVMLNAAGIVFVAASSHWGEADGQVMFLFILVMTAAEVAVGLALVLLMFKRYATLDVDRIQEMKG